MTSPILDESRLALPISFSDSFMEVEILLPDTFLYCARGNAEAKVDKKGCRCPECPAYRIYDLKGVNGSPYFCEKGKAP